MNFIFKALLKKQLKHLPEDQVDMLITVIEKNPDFFKKIAEEIQAKVQSGVSEQDAAMEVMKLHGDEMRKILTQ